jgi:catechol 2,3-dioxygenase-like lactoylglutathione lyase family enzyme
MYLNETHVPVRNSEASRRFYVEVVGLEIAYRDPSRDIVFLWIGPPRRSMLGLWGPDAVYGRQHLKCHFAMAVSLPELLARGARLKGLGVPTRNFFGEETTEPSVFGWMPAARLYFSDPDGHSLEFIALLDGHPMLPLWGHGRCGGKGTSPLSRQTGGAVNVCRASGPWPCEPAQRVVR